MFVALNSNVQRVWEMFRTLQSPDWPAICARHPYFGTHKSAFGNRLKCALRWGLSGNRFISIRRLECVVFVCEGCRRQIFFESHPLAWYVNLWELPGTWQVAKHFSEVCPLEWWGVGYVTSATADSAKIPVKHGETMAFLAQNNSVPHPFFLLRSKN